MEHVEYYDLLRDVHAAVERLFALDDVMNFKYYFDDECYMWVLIYQTEEE